MWQFWRLLASQHCIYNEIDGLKQLIPSLRLGEGGVDVAVFIDGIFPGFEGKDYLSTDGSRELILEYQDKNPDTVVLLDMPAEEFFKRELANHYIRYRGIPFILILDGDEYIMNNRTDWKRFRDNLQKIYDRNDEHNIFGIDVNYGSWDQFWSKPRLWFKPWEVGYIHGSHWRFGNIYHSRFYDLAIQSDRIFEPVKGLAIREKSTVRTDSRDKQMGEYQKDTVIPFESSMNEQFKMQQ